MGLGNFGQKYEKTNHNMGFIVIDKVANELNLKFDKKECDSYLAKTYLNGEVLLLCKPTTYMNESGVAFKQLKNKYNLKDEEILVIVDDIDLDVGRIRIREKGSAGTHNGLRSIVRETNATNYKRIRVGVGKPPEFMSLTDFVLAHFKQTKDMENAWEKAKNAVIDLINGEDMQKVMGKYN